MPTCGLGRHGSVTVRRQTRALVEPIFRGLDAEDVYRDLSQSRIRSIDALNAIVERYELAARFAGRMLAREGSASPAHLKVRRTGSCEAHCDHQTPEAHYCDEHISDCRI